MRVLVAFDKFKDALSAQDACRVASGAIEEAHPDWDIDLCPLTDGGDGFCRTLTEAVGGRLRSETVTGPRGDKIAASIGFVDAAQLNARTRAALALNPEKNLAVVEMASASGLTQLSLEQRNPWFTTSTGTGELLRIAAREADAIVLGIGGSATIDLGFGALRALGFTFRDESGEAIAIPSPSTWKRIVGIEGRATLPPIYIACDVTIPLLGPNGAVSTFGAQKGLHPDEAQDFEIQMQRMATMLADSCGLSHSTMEMPGAGAAGGIGFGLMAVSSAKLVSGYDLVADWLNLQTRISRADLILTGEGRYDRTSLSGKAPGRLATVARGLGKSTLVFAGQLEMLPDAKHYVITPREMSLKDALPRTAELLRRSVLSTLPP